MPSGLSRIEPPPLLAAFSLAHTGAGQVVRLVAPMRIGVRKTILNVRPSVWSGCGVKHCIIRLPVEQNCVVDRAVLAVQFIMRVRPPPDDLTSEIGRSEHAVQNNLQIM